LGSQYFNGFWWLPSILSFSKQKIKEEGVKFKSHIDGSYHFYSGKCNEIQRSIGADIIMAFDECTILVTIIAKRSMKMTHRWLDRCVNHLEKFL
jgi:queuine tRNA-ribosyltransferase